MAGKIAALFGGRSRPKIDTNPHPGIGGYALGAGPANETGFPGSTSSTRTFAGNSPRVAKIRSDTDSGFEQAPGTAPQVRQSSYRGDVPGASTRSPRATPLTASWQPRLTQIMQENSRAEFYGGPMLHTGPDNNTAGGVPGAPAAGAGGHSQRETQTLWSAAQPVIGTDVPGSENVRNQVAQRYKNRPGQEHSYRSAARPDQAPANRGGQATDGNVHPDAATTEVSVPNRFVFPGGGNTTWAVLREMPYGGRGDGARGAALNGQRYFASGQGQQFMNGGQGDYGVARLAGGDHKRPVSFAEPGPWTANFYDTTASVQDGADEQAPSNVYVSPRSGRASNGTGRRG